MALILFFSFIIEMPIIFSYPNNIKRSEYIKFYLNLGIKINLNFRFDIIYLSIHKRCIFSVDEIDLVVCVFRVDNFPQGLSPRSHLSSSGNQFCPRGQVNS